MSIMRNIITMTMPITVATTICTIMSWNMNWNTLLMNRLMVMRQKCCWTLPMPPLTNKQHTNTLYMVMTRMEHMQGTEPITPAMK